MFGFTFDQGIQIAYVGITLGVGVGVLVIGTICIRLFFLFRVHPGVDTPKAREFARAKAEKETELAVKRFAQRFVAAKDAPVEVQLEVIKLFRDEVRANAADWKVFGLGGSKEEGLAQRGARVVNEADVLLTELQKTSVWGQLEPMLKALVFRTTGFMPGSIPTPATEAPMVLSAPLPDATPAVPAVQPAATAPEPIGTGIKPTS